jgi:hypothetical protein
MEDPEFGVDILFTDYREPTNSQVIDETIKSTITAEFREASKEAFITGAYSADWKEPAKEVLIVNDSTATIPAVITNDSEHPVPTQEISG